MGGYMGFGMANWIYRQRPRQPFSKRRSKPSCNTLDTYDREFKIQSSQNTSKLYIYFSFLVILLVVFSMYFQSPKFMDYSNELLTHQKATQEKTDAEAFQFLMNSGLKRLRSNDLIGAYSELKLAYAIYPENERVNMVLIETLGALCKDDNTYCSELDSVLMSSNEIGNQIGN